MKNTITLITAPLVLPIATSPIRDGAVVVSRDGIILDCGPRCDVRDRFPTIPERRYEAVLVPGFINTHCHLELSHLRGQLQSGGGLPDFVRQIMDLRNIAPENIEQGIQEGLQELRQEGVVGVVDVGNTGRALPYLRDSGLYGLFLLELINFDPEAAEKVFEEGRAFLNRLQCGDVETQKQGKSHDVPASPRSRASASQHIATGLTGHAIYSCSEPLLRKIAAYAVQTNTPISLHLLESLEERALIEGGGGFFATFLRQLGYSLDAWKAPEISSLFYAERCLGTKARRLYVHLVHIREEELHYLASQPDTFIALCPKSNLFMGEPLPPIDRIGAVHPNITIGTDSLASNNRLSILEELRTIQLAFPLISSETLIRWATLNGARYLGLEGMLGSFTPRKQPGILAIYTSQLEPDTFLMGRDLSLIPICPEPQN